MCSYRKVKVGQLYRICPDMRSGCENANPPNGLGMSRAAILDRESCRADSSLQNANDLGAAKRRYNESDAASIRALAQEANYG